MKDIRKIQDPDEFEEYFVRKLKTVGLSKEQKEKILEILEDLMLTQRPHPKAQAHVRDFYELTIQGINLTHRLFRGDPINFRDILDDEVLDDEET